MDEGTATVTKKSYRHLETILLTQGPAYPISTEFTALLSKPLDHSLILDICRMYEHPPSVWHSVGPEHWTTRGWALLWSRMLPSVSLPRCLFLTFVRSF